MIFSISFPFYARPNAFTLRYRFLSLSNATLRLKYIEEEQSFQRNLIKTFKTVVTKRTFVKILNKVSR